MQIKSKLPSGLSPREVEILKWTACGKTGPEIAQFLDLSDETVRSHMRNICHKLDAVNKTHATAIALVHGMIPSGASPERVIPLPTLLGLSRDPLSGSAKSNLRIRKSQKIREG